MLETLHIAARNQLLRLGFPLHASYVYTEMVQVVRVLNVR